MKRTTLIICLLLAGLSSGSQASPRIHKPRRVVNTPAERRMDRNHDGIVQNREVAVAKSRGVVKPAMVVKTPVVVKSAAVVDRPWEKAADGNHDGIVSRVELRNHIRGKLDANGDGRIVYAERVTYWAQRWAVSSDAEKAYDLDGDAYLSWTEAQAMLRAKHALILAEGQAPVETDLELEFDINGDGLLDRTEAPALALAIAAAA